MKHKVTVFQTYKMRVWAVDWEIPEEIKWDCSQARVVYVETKEEVEKILNSSKKIRDILYRWV